MLPILITCTVIITLVFVVATLIFRQQLTLNAKLNTLTIQLEERQTHFNELRDHLLRVTQAQQKDQQEQRTRFDEYQLASLKSTHETIQKGLYDIQKHISDTLTHNTQELNRRVDQLNQNTAKHLKEISGEVEKRLTDGFEKTTATFADVVKRLALIDQAQKKITELSSNVVSLQEVLSDKKSRGAFGEVQLSALISNMLPEQNYSMQHTFSNGKRADCVLFLPEPTGTIAIDAKFPLESYRRLMGANLTEAERKVAQTQFKQDIRKHVQDIAERYIIANETSDGAVMFIPAESVFAEIHAHYPELVDEAHRTHVWIVSPTTMMAILSTARAVLKDAATRKQVHIIQEHLIQLSRDFSRFQKRMDNLSKHIHQAHTDVEDIHKSSKKITSRFQKIEQVELQDGSERLDPMLPVEID